MAFRTIDENGERVAVGTTYSTVGDALGRLDTNIVNVRNNAIMWNAAAGAFDASHNGKAQVIMNVANGSVASTSTDAVNGGQLYGLGDHVAEALGGGASFAGGRWQGPTYSLRTIDTDGAVEAYQDYGTVGDALGGVGANIVNVRNNAIMWNATAAAFDAGHFGNAQKIIDVANGNVDLGSTDAVNGGQLYGLGDHVAAALGGGASFDQGNWTGPTYVIDKHNYSDVGSALERIDDSISGGAGIKYFHANSTLADSSAQGTDSVAIGPNARSVSTGSIAIGKNATAGWRFLGLESTGAVALGDDAAALGTNSVALGTDASAAGINSLAFGAHASAVGISSLAFGPDASATGLGTVALGSDASALGINSLALGTDAAAGGVNSLALGNGASTAAINSVALGAGSVAFENNAISVGSKGFERKIINVAPGDISTATSTDAVNGAQLYATNQTINNLGDDALLWNSTDGAFSASHGEVADNKIINLAAGMLSSTSTDAVNGSQLYGLGSDVATAMGGSASFENGVWLKPGYVIDGKTYNDVGAALSALEDNFSGGGNIKYFHVNSSWKDSSATGRNAIAIGPNALAMANGSIAIGLNAKVTGYHNNSVALGAGSQANADNVVSVGAPKSERRIVNVADGYISKSSTDAINGSQLFATNTNVTNLGDQITTLGNDALVWDAAANGGNGAFSASHGTSTTNKITNLQDAALATDSTDAVNGSQLFATNTNVTNLGDQITTLGNDALVWDAAANGGNGAFSASHSGVAPNKITNVAAGDVSNGSTDAINGGQFYGLASSTATILGVSKDSFTVDAAGNISPPNYHVAGKIYTNVADAIDALDNDIGGGGSGGNIKYFHVNSSASDVSWAKGENAIAIGPNTKVHGDNSVAIGSGAEIQGNDSDAIAIGSDAQIGGYASHSMAIGSGAQIGQHASYSIAIGSGAIVQADNSVALGAGSQADADNVVSVGTSSYQRRIVNVADGDISKSSTDAVNGSQIYRNSAAVASVLGARVNSDGSIVTPTYTIGGKSFGDVGNALSSLDGRVTSNASNITSLNKSVTRLTSSANSFSAALSNLNFNMDAINSRMSTFGNQMTTLYRSPANSGSTEAAAAPPPAAAAPASNGVEYDVDASGNKQNSITLEGGDPDAPVTIHNVATGVANTDAVNVGQMQQAVASTRQYADQRASETLQQANAYTDQKYSDLSQDIDNTRKEARQAAAIGLAAASLRYDDRPGKLSASIGGGAWRGEGAMAMGIGYTTPDGNVRANVSATTAGDQWGFGGGVSFTLN